MACLPPHGDQHFGRRVFGAELLMVPVANGPFQFCDSASRRVLSKALLDGADGGLADIVGGDEIRLTRAEIHQVGARRPGPFGLHHHGLRGAHRNSRNTFG